jgi:uncharacterized membrane protein
MPERSEFNARARRPGPEHLARKLGWLSIGLGVTQVLLPRTMARLTGVPIPRTLMVLCGLRGLACGIGLLTQPNPVPWVNTRVAGDALDLGGLVAGIAFGRTDPKRLALSSAAVAGIAAFDIYSARELGEHERRKPQYVATSVVIDRPAGELYRFWRSFENLPQVMPHLQSVRAIDDKHLHWVAHAPWGGSVEWRSELIDDVPERRLAWRTSDGSDVFNAGSVRFNPVADGSSTEVIVELLYVAPAGAVGATVAKIFGKDAGQDVFADLDAFKRIMESGQGASRTSEAREVAEENHRFPSVP